MSGCPFRTVLCSECVAFFHLVRRRLDLSLPPFNLRQQSPNDARGGSGSATNPLKPKEGLNGPRIFLGWGAGSFVPQLATGKLSSQHGMGSTLCCEGFFCAQRQAASDGNKLVPGSYPLLPEAHLEDVADGGHQRTAACKKHPIHLFSADTRTLQERVDALFNSMQLVGDPTLKGLTGHGDADVHAAITKIEIRHVNMR